MLALLVAAIVLFSFFGALFGVSSDQPSAGVGGMPIGFVDGIPYADIFNGTASIGIDPRLVAAVAFAESGFAPDVVNCSRTSPYAGALGIMQFMPSTAAGMGINPCDPAEAIPAGARYLLTQYQVFQRWELALAAYNAGPGAVTIYHGIPPYAETVAYVPKVMAKWNEYQLQFPSGNLGTEAPFGPLGGTERYTESRITATMQRLLDAVVPIFGRGQGIGCYRDQGDGEHPKGRACDFIMQRPLNHMPSPQYLEHGWAMANWLVANAAAYDVYYVIWQDRIWSSSRADEGWRDYVPYSNGSPIPNPNLQQNHYDHIHVSVY